MTQEQIVDRFRRESSRYYSHVEGQNVYRVLPSPAGPMTSGEITAFVARHYDCVPGCLNCKDSGIQQLRNKVTPQSYSPMKRNSV